MPKSFRKVRRRSGGKRKVVRGKRRLTSAPIFMSPPSAGYYHSMTARPTGASTAAKKKRYRMAKKRRNSTFVGPNPQALFRGGNSQQGKDVIPAAYRGTYSRSGTVKKGIKRQIMDALVYGANPILRSDIKAIPSQLDWLSGQQAHTTIEMGNRPVDIERKYLKCRDASYFNAAVAYPSATTDVASQRMTVFPSTFIVNMKNTCSHTCYIEARVYKAKGYHTISSVAAWQESLANDNLVQNHLAAPFPNEETIYSLYKRPDMKSVYLNTRYSEMTRARAKWVLEPGQETKFIFKMPGFSYDQARYNVLVGGDDPTRCPQTYELQLFAHAEMVTGAIDTDVCPGSGHIAINTQLIESWQGLPIVKKYQNMASYGWGDIIQGDEQDMENDAAALDGYEEGV